jgi:hypothetical protein
MAWLPASMYLGVWRRVRTGMLSRTHRHIRIVLRDTIHQDAGNRNEPWAGIMTLSESGFSRSRFGEPELVWMHT